MGKLATQRLSFLITSIRQCSGAALVHIAEAGCWPSRAFAVNHTPSTLARLQVESGKPLTRDAPGPRFLIANRSRRSARWLFPRRIQTSSTLAPAKLTCGRIFLSVRAFTSQATPGEAGHFWDFQIRARLAACWLILKTRMSFWLPRLATALVQI